MGSLALALRVAAAEGAVATADRIRDRADEWWSRRTFRRARDGVRIAAPVLNVLSTPPARRLGGLQIQFLRRLAREADARACAVLYPLAGRYRLECRHAGRREAMTLPGPALAPPVCLEHVAFEDAVLRAVQLVGARAVHLEGLAGTPPLSALRIARSGLPVILSLHDFALFCPRPDLLERPRSTFCGYCEEPSRCRACLAHDWGVAPDFQARYRAAGAELLKRAVAVIYPSSYLRSAFLRLVRDLDPRTQHVIEPASERPARPPAAAASVIRHVAFVGAVQVRKGALVFEELVRRFQTTAGDRVRWSVFGGGEPALVRRLAGLRGVAVRGYYRAGTLPELLRRHRVDLALLLSIVPESYGLALDECRQAGVTVLAFDHGAIGERVRTHGGGVLVPLEAGAGGVLDALTRLLNDAGSRPPAAMLECPWGASEAARAHLRLYDELGLA
jgi:glycosyltransferase involved in cell wall biosynthesis